MEGHVAIETEPLGLGQDVHIPRMCQRLIASRPATEEERTAGNGSPFRGAEMRVHADNDTIRPRITCRVRDLQHGVI
jgi:hypothetical protein